MINKRISNTGLVFLLAIVLTAFSCKEQKKADEKTEEVTATTSEETPEFQLPDLPFPMIVKPKNEAVSFGLNVNF